MRELELHWYSSDLNEYNTRKDYVRVVNNTTFCARGGDELSTITVENIFVKRVENNWKVCFKHIEKKSKNKQGGLAAINREKVIHFDLHNTPHTFTDYYLTFLSRTHPSVLTNGSGVRLF